MKDFDLKKFFNELQSLNPKDPGGWPWAVKGMAFAAIFIAGIAGGYFALWSSQIDELQAKQAQETQLKQKFIDDKRQAVNLDLIKKQLQDTQRTFSSLLKQLPSKAEVDVLLREINRAGLENGLQFELFQPNKEINKGMLIEQPISIQVTGGYDDIAKFASDVSQLSRIVILNDIAITVLSSGGTGKGSSARQLSMTADAHTYRYRDEVVQSAPPKPGAKP